jgi:two-component system phosphate regulon sensor histidine kinase PhoR
MESDLTRAIIDAFPEPAVLIAQGGRVAVMNAQSRDLLGAGGEGRPYAVALRQPSVGAAIEAAMAHGEEGIARHVVAGPGTETVYRVTVRAIRGHGQAGVLCVFQDVTDQEQVGQMRRDFVANVSHELRTPLTALLGFIETLRGAARDDSAARERFLGVMEREASRMNRLVSDLLQLSRVEAAERVRPSDPVDLGQVLAMTLTAVRPLAEAAGVELQFDAPRALMVPGDADQLTQVFQNLIENAVKYGGAGKRVTITLAQGEKGAEVSVRDFGEGIPAIHIPRLTERFYRVDSHRSREKGGTGLGLAIVKHIVNRHRGRLLIDSTEGKGSTFTVILPEIRDIRAAQAKISAT